MSEKKRFQMSEGITRRCITMTFELVDFLLDKSASESQRRGTKVTMSDLVIEAVYEKYKDAPYDAKRMEKKQKR